MANTHSPIFEDVLDKHLRRRGFLKSTALLSGALALNSCTTSPASTHVDLNASVTPKSLPFRELAHGLDENLAVAEGYRSHVLIRWGDPIFENVGEFDLSALNESEQLKRFGYNNDYVGFLPLPEGADDSNRGLLVVNHEYTIPQLMYPGSPTDWSLTAEQVEADIAAHGMSVVEIEKIDDEWRVKLNSRFNRRITPNTPMTIAGPAAGSDRLKTIYSDDGVETLGTYSNCAGGITPWGTVLTGEENVDGCFIGNIDATKEAENYRRFGVRNWKNWGVHQDRWNLDKNPNEMLHAGWVVEVDPFDPQSKPKKRTSLGRIKHEGCNVFINKDQRVVAYTGDDQHFEYIYKFVSKHRFQPEQREANMDLLDEGTLYAARFNDDGTLNWLPLVYGEGPLTEANGFYSQADVSLDTRKAGDLVGATPMDRPEDVEVNPHNGRVYAMLTNNTKRKAEQVGAANPRAHNSRGQIIEFWPEDGDHVAETFAWELFLLAGNPAKDELTKYHDATSESGWLSCPDNCAFDGLGNLWIATDGAEKSGVAEGLWATEVGGDAKALTKRFLRIPMGSELCGPFFTPNSENLFVAVQHPGQGSNFDKPDTRWPDFSPDMPPRPSVVVITKEGGGRIGT